MSIEIGETLISYELLKLLDKAEKAGVFVDIAVKGENENRYVSELDARMTALDDKSVFIALNTFIKHHKKTVIKTLEYLEREGEKNETDKHI